VEEVNMMRVRLFGAAIVFTGLLLATGCSLSNPQIGEAPSRGAVAAQLPPKLEPGLFVAPGGDDANSGMLDKPLLTVHQGLITLKPGETLYLRGGTYAMPASVTLSGQGTADRHYSLCAYPGEKPVLDFAGSAGRSRGIALAGSYWLVKGLEITNASGGMNITGSYNTVEQCVTHDNRETGMQLGNGAAHNRIINCDSYYNADPSANYANADGFAPKLTVGDDNSFYGCRSWGNCDDGWDGYMRGANDVTTRLENCWTWGNGFLKDGRDPGAQANGNGFKMGGGDGSNSQKLMHHFILKNCVAFANKAKGFDQNNNVGSMTMLNCTGYRNGGGNFMIVKPLVEGQKLTVKNCISFDGRVQLGDFAVQEHNSWLMNMVPTAEDFVSIDPESLKAPRKADGSLPEIKFLHLAAGSKMIGAGADVGLPFTGKAPDLGAFAFVR
jgi:hypothetical protein